VATTMAAPSTSTSGPSATLDIFGGDGSDNVVLEGSLSAPSGPSSTSASASVGTSNVNTLDEPVRETILRDVKAVGQKFLHVLYPVEKKSLLRDWDLWGPLILCTLMATLLQGHETEVKDGGAAGDGGPEFAEVFVIVWVGALIVTLNTKLLGGSISFFQSVCVLGYCLLPLSLALLICRVILMASTQSTALFIIRCISVLAGFVWAAYASMQFLGDCQPPRRKALAAYPMFLFYFLIGWMVISHSN